MQDARRLVLAPIERMMVVIEYMAIDPLQEVVVSAPALFSNRTHGDF